MITLPTIEGGFKVVLADPAWSFLTRSNKGKGRSPEQHYQCMTFEDIKAMPVSDIAAKDSVLLMWTTDPMLEKSFEVIKAWGFTFKTPGFIWVKTNSKSNSYFMGCGYYTRANPEYCLLATKGKGVQRLNRGVPKLIVSPRREHSRKPDETYERVEKLFAGPYCELFARTTRLGWSVWGNETDKFGDRLTGSDIGL